RDASMARIAATLGADQQAVRDDFAAWNSRRRMGPSRAPQQAPAGTGEAAQKGMTPDLFLMLVVAANRDLFPQVRNGGVALADLEDERARSVFVALEESYRAEEKGFEAVCARIDDPRLRELAIARVASGELDINPERMVADGVRGVRQRTLRKRIDSLNAEMRRTEKQDPARTRELLAEKIHLDSEMERLKTRAAGA
ncbi:MAG TPA: hypothetical protein VHE79_06815, partial [Spirochaetia bacterium]